MKIEVRRRDNTVELVEDYFLQLMIDMNEVDSFKRSSGWVRVGVDPIRRSRQSFTGKDRRLPGFGALNAWRTDGKHQ